MVNWNTQNLSVGSSRNPGNNAGQGQAGKFTKRCYFEQELTRILKHQQD